MDITVLIDAIVRQTMVLIAHLATVSGTRAPLTSVVDQVFLDLSAELRRQGLSPKVIADMFGIAIRTYHSKVRRLSEQANAHRRILWQEVYAHIRDEGPVLRARLLSRPRFARADDAMMRSILQDLVDTGLVFVSGRGDRQIYGALPPDQIAAALDDHEALDTLLRVVVFHLSPVGIDGLAGHMGIDPDRIRPALERLVERGEVEVDEGPEGSRYHCRRYLVPLGSEGGWEAAVFDHFQAAVNAICGRLSDQPPELADVTGGSTYAFEIWPDHPRSADVLDLFRRVRAEASALRAEVDAFNDGFESLPGGVRRVVFYCGQAVRVDEGE